MQGEQNTPYTMAFENAVSLIFNRSISNTLTKKANGKVKIRKNK